MEPLWNLMELEPVRAFSKILGAFQKPFKANRRIFTPYPLQHAQGAQQRERWHEAKRDCTSAAPILDITILHGLYVALRFFSKPVVAPCMATHLGKTRGAQTWP